MKSDPRQMALETLLKVDGGAFADLALDAALSANPDLDPRDRGLATELIYGILRQRGRLDFALRRFCRQPLAKVEPRVLWLLRLGAYQILQLDRIPDRAAVHATVELARQLGLERATGFINGILRALGREGENIPWPDPATAPLAALEYSHSLPPWLAKRWLAEFGAEEALALAAAMRQPAPFTVRANTLRIGREPLLEQLRLAGHHAEPTRFAPEGIVLTTRGATPLPGDREGWYQVQDEASMLIAHLLAPQPGERILDACAAPGGKTTHIAALTANRANIVALDLHPQRIALVNAGARRLGVTGIDARPWDLTSSADFIPPESFDRILVDAPCSGLGVLRRNPEIRWRRRPEEIAEVTKLQQKILANVAPLLRPGGTLLYSLCTLTPEETTGVLDVFLAAHPQFAIEDGRDFAPPHWRELFDSQGALRTLPHRHGGMDAFFAVRLRRQA
ncbi:MAG: 16S rRNA (cytosine(967)-C(5))-methyltransferase RsmB [Desulfuromonadales bacterium]